MMTSADFLENNQTTASHIQKIKARITMNKLF